MTDDADAQITHVEMADAGPVSHVSPAGMMVDYAHYPTGEVVTVRHGNGRWTTYLYRDTRGLHHFGNREDRQQQGHHQPADHHAEKDDDRRLDHGGL